MTPKRLTLLVIALALLAACAGHQAIINAALRDTIFSIEDRANGGIVMWMTHDDVGTYCTIDTALEQKARDLFLTGQDVIVHYRSLNANDKENGALNGLFQGACNTDRDNSNSNVTNYLITAIEAAPAPDGPATAGRNKP